MSIRHARVPAFAGASGLLLMLSVGVAGPVRADPGTAPPGDVALYPVVSGYGANGVTTGPDGNIWYTVPSRNLVGVVSPEGVPIATYPVPGAPSAIVDGPGRALWFDIGQYQGNAPAIGELTTSGTLSVFPLPAADGTGANGLAAGSDGNLWYTVDGVAGGNGQVAAMTPQGAVTHYPLPVPFTGGVHDITAGPDGNLWFVGQAGDNPLASELGTVTPDGTVTLHSLPHGYGGPGGITAGPDDRLWFTENSGAGGLSTVGTVDTSGNISFYPLSAANLHPAAITTGADGRVWLTESTGPDGAVGGGIVGMTTAGDAAVYPGPPAGSPAAITAGSDGDLWFTDAALGQLGELTTTRPYAARITLASDSNPAFFGQSGGLVATVTPAAAGSPAPTGAVTFVPAGGNPTTEPLVNGAATFPLSLLGNGTTSVQALYDGDAGYGPVSFQGLQQTVQRAATDTTLSASANPARAGQNITITAAVAPAAPAGGVPGGSVTFTIDGADQTVPVQDGAATTTLWSPTVGAHSVDASYTPDGLDLNHNNYLPSSTSMTQTVDPVTPDGCPCSVFTPAATPAQADSGDGSSVELGMKFRTLKKGDITGVRFYKSDFNTGVHTGSLWGSDGTLLATGTFANETADGWQSLTFAKPVPARVGMTYVVSYHAPLGHYSYDGGYFAGGTAGASPIEGLGTGVDGDNGVFAYGARSSFPNSSYQSANYWVDAIFDSAGVPTTGPTAAAASPAAGATGVATTAAVTATFSAPLAGTPTVRVTDPSGAEVPGTVGYDPASGTATFTPATQLPGGTTYTVSAFGVDAWGQAQAAPSTWSFTTGTAAPAYSCPCSLFGPGDAPAVANSGDANSLEVGTRFVPAVNGTVTGVRFYKGTLNTGTHTGSLWGADGTLLATGTFSGESDSGWQTLTFATPVAVTAGTTYVASYHAANGDYSYTAGYFGYRHEEYPLAAPAAGTQTGNGVYAYGSSTLFPQYGSAGGTNYWVDPVFTASP